MNLIVFTYIDTIKLKSNFINNACIIVKLDVLIQGGSA
jgi:hypothetical protein